MNTDFQKDISDDYDGDNSENITLTGSKLKNRSCSPLSKGNHLHNDCRNLEGWDIIAKKIRIARMHQSMMVMMMMRRRRRYLNDGDEMKKSQRSLQGLGQIFDFVIFMTMII